MRILGIDFGSSSIKAVEMDSAFGRYDIHDYHETPVEPGFSRESAISSLVKSLPKSPDRIIVALPPGQSTFRNLQLPTRDKKAIQSGVGFEMEDELPFPVEDSAYDYAILSQSKQGSAVHVAATLKQHLTAHLQMWQRAEVAPDVITTDVWPYRTLLNRVTQSSNQDSPVLLIQMGHERTTFYLHWKGAPVLLRELSWGGRDLTTAICQRFNISYEQAENLKLDRGLGGAFEGGLEGGIGSDLEGGMKASANDDELSDCLEKSLEKLMNELRQVGLMAKSVTHQSISLIYTAGGTSLLPGLGQWIEKAMKIPTQPLLALSSITPSGVTYSNQTDARFLFAASLTLSLVGSDRASCINFRKGEFSKEGRARELNVTALKKPLIAVGIVSVCLFLSLIIQSRVYQSRLTATDALLERSVRSFFGSLSTSAMKTYLSNTSTLRASITKELNKQRELSRLFGPNSRSPLDFLNSISKAIPKNVVVDLIQFQAGSPVSDPFTSNDQNQSANLAFLVSNPQMAEKLANSVSPKLSNIQRGKLEESKLPDNTAKWKISFTGKPTEDSYGK